MMNDMHPEIRHVVYPVHRDGSRTGAQPRLRHDPDCGHFEWEDGVRLGTPELASDEQMRTLRACKTCIGSRGEASGTVRGKWREARAGGLCRTCNQLLSLTGRCDACDG